MIVIIPYWIIKYVNKNIKIIKKEKWIILNLFKILFV